LCVAGGKKREKRENASSVPEGRKADRREGGVSKYTPGRERKKKKGRGIEDCAASHGKEGGLNGLETLREEKMPVGIQVGKRRLLPS